jgi:hypothetical protein
MATHTCHGGACRPVGGADAEEREERQEKDDAEDGLLVEDVQGGEEDLDVAQAYEWRSIGVRVRGYKNEQDKNREDDRCDRARHDRERPSPSWPMRLAAQECVEERRGCDAHVAARAPRRKQQEWDAQRAPQDAHADGSAQGHCSFGSDEDRRREGRAGERSEEDGGVPSGGSDGVAHPR